jgi:hypothetical protein
MNHYPMTKGQRESLDHQLATMMEELGDTAILLNACYGDKDQRVERAQSAQAAVQRLVWALERNTEPAQGGGEKMELEPSSASAVQKTTFSGDR